jgi:hypothetical protein
MNGKREEAGERVGVENFNKVVQDEGRGARERGGGGFKRSSTKPGAWHRPGLLW